MVRSSRKTTAFDMKLFPCYRIGQKYIAVVYCEAYIRGTLIL